jgi:hypothetical protein
MGDDYSSRPFVASLDGLALAAQRMRMCWGVWVWIWCGSGFGLGPGLLLFNYFRMDDDDLRLGLGGVAAIAIGATRPFFVGMTSSRVSFSWWAEAGRRKAEGGRRKAEGGRRKAEGGRWKMEDLFPSILLRPFLSFSLFFWVAEGRGGMHGCLCLSLSLLSFSGLHALGHVSQSLASAVFLFLFFFDCPPPSLKLNTNCLSNSDTNTTAAL